MIKNILANWSHIFFSIVSIFILYPFFIQTLGEEQYGIWLLISSVTGYFTLIQVGVPLANVRFVSKYYAQGDYKRLNEILGTILFLFGGMAILTFLVGCGVSLVLENIFDIPQQYLEQAKLAMILASLEISLKFVAEVVVGVLHARRKFVVLNTIWNVMVVVRLGLSLWLVTYDYGLIWIVSLLLISTILQSAILFYYVKKKYPRLKFVPRFASRSVLSEIFGYSGFVLLFQVASRISFQTDALVLASVVSVASVVWFGVAGNMLLHLTKMITGIAAVVMPKISELDALGKKEEIKKSYLRGIRITGLLVFPICLALHLFGGDFIHLWMGESYREESSRVLSILALGYIFFLVQRGVGFPVLMGISKMKWPTIIMFAGALVNLILSIWWGKLYGISGVAWGTTCPTLVVSFALMCYTATLLQIKLRSIIYQSILLPALSLPLLYCGYWVAERFVTLPSYSGLFVRGGIAAVCCLGSVYFLLDKPERYRVQAIFKKT